MNVRSWPIADVRTGRPTAGLLMSASDPKRTAGPPRVILWAASMFPSLIEINQVEQGYVGPESSPTLGRSFNMLMARWDAGERDRETALRLLFLGWYAHCEPPFLTGLFDVEQTICAEAFAALGDVGTSDPEVCFVMSLMADTYPWALGDEMYWAQIGQVLSVRGAKLQPGGVPSSVFCGRGAYGAYFTHALTVGAGR